MLASELFEHTICPVCGCTPCNCTHIVFEDEQLDELAPSKGFGGNDGPSKIVQIVDRLLKSGNKVDCMVLGARGHVVKAELTDNNWGNGGLHMKKYNKPYAKTGLFRPFVTADDDKYEVVPVGPKHYAIKDVWPEEFNEDSDPCWPGYKQIGMKKKAGKSVPNCVPKESVEEQADWREISAKSNLQPGVPVMIWLGPRNQNPPRDDKKYWERGVVMDSPEWIDGQWRVLVKTDTKSQWPINPERVFVLKKDVAETRGVKSDFRKQVDQQQKKVINTLASSKHSDAIKEYLIAINDPCGPVYKLAYRSYTKGQEAKEKVRDLIAKKYGVAPKILDDAELAHIARGIRGVSEATDIALAANPEDTVSLDIPLLIRLLEYAREDAKTDMDLHNVAERLITLSAGGQTLSMNDYDNVIPGTSD